MRRTIGIVGGLSPESTVTYYQTIVRRHVERTGDHSYPRIVVASVSFQEYIDWQHAGQWDRIAEGLNAELAALAAAGADLALLASNTVHKVLADLRSPVPLIPVFDAVAEACAATGARRLGLTGTRFTMSDGFFTRAMATRGIELIAPDPSAQDDLHRIIYDDLIRGVVTEPARERMRAIAGELVAAGADAVLLACTELQLLADGGLGAPIIDTATCHAELAWRMATAPGDS